MWPEPQSGSHPRNIYRGPAVTIPGPWCTTAPNTSVVTLDMGAMRNDRDLLALEHPRLSPWSSAPNPFVISPGLMELSIISMMLTPKFIPPLYLFPEPPTHMPSQHIHWMPKRKVKAACPNLRFPSSALPTPCI